VGNGCILISFVEEDLHQVEELDAVDTGRRSC